MVTYPKAHLVSSVSAIPEVLLLYLFGSRADGTAGASSDYDFGVLTGSGRQWDVVRTLVAEALAAECHGASVDLVCLNRAPVELAYAVIASGRLLFERDVAARVEFEAKVMGLYGDYLPVLREQRRDILAGGDHEARVQRYRAALGRVVWVNAG